MARLRCRACVITPGSTLPIRYRACKQSAVSALPINVESSASTQEGEGFGDRGAVVRKPVFVAQPDMSGFPLTCWIDGRFLGRIAIY